MNNFRMFNFYRQVLFLTCLLFYQSIASGQVRNTLDIYMNDVNLSLTNDEFAEEVLVDVVDDKEHIYLTGYSLSPTSSNTYEYCSDTKYLGNGDAFLAKYIYNPADETLSQEWIKYLGSKGTSGNPNDDFYDWSYCMALDHDGSDTYIYIGGAVLANDDAGDQKMNCDDCNNDDGLKENTNDNWDGFIAKYDAEDGALIAFTYLGEGSMGNPKDLVLGLAIRPGNDHDIYAVGYTDASGLHIVATGIYNDDAGGSGDGFIAGFDKCLTKMNYFTYYTINDSEMPAERDRCHGLVFSEDGNELYVSGTTDGSTGGIATGGTYQTTPGSGTPDAFVGKWIWNSNDEIFEPAWGTYIGGNDVERGRRLDISHPAFTDKTYVYATCWTQSTDLATPGSPIMADHANDAGTSGYKSDAFVIKLSGEYGTALWATYFGGNGEDKPNAIDWYFTNGGPSGIAISGITGSDDAGGFINSYTGNDKLKDSPSGENDAFYALLYDEGRAVTLSYATYLGGSDDDENYGPPDDGTCHCLFNNQFTGYGPFISTIPSGFGVAYVSFSTNSADVHDFLPDGKDHGTYYNAGYNIVCPNCTTSTHKNYDAFLVRLNLCSNPQNCTPFRTQSNESTSLEAQYDQAASTINITIESAHRQQQASLSIYNKNGSELFYEKIQLGEGINSKSIKLKVRPDEKYFARLITDTGSSLVEVE
jgi:hypothetical protein